MNKSSTSNETTITIPAENSSTTDNNNGKLKQYFISRFNDQSKFSWKFQVQIKTIKTVVKFLDAFYTSCFASCCPFSGF